MEKDKENYRTSVSCFNYTKKRLRKFELHPRETDEDILNRLMNNMEKIGE